MSLCDRRYGFGLPAISPHGADALLGVVALHAAYGQKCAESVEQVLAEAGARNRPANPFHRPPVEGRFRPLQLRVVILDHFSDIDGGLRLERQDNEVAFPYLIGKRPDFAYPILDRLGLCVTSVLFLRLNPGEMSLALVG